MMAQPISDGFIPHEVQMRIAELQKRIIKGQRSQRGRDQAEARKAASTKPKTLLEIFTSQEEGK